jgi:predicted P-loop ATPase
MSIVSLYPHIKETKNGSNVSLHGLVDQIRSDKWREKIEFLRRRIQEGAPKEEIEELKRGLPYFTASGTFLERNDKGLIEHSGKIAIDFDKLEDIDQTRTVLENDKYTEYLFLSCSGRGLCVIANIDPDKHLESFKFLENHYKTAYGLEIDKACKDVSRPRYVSFDENVFHQPEYAFVKLSQYNSDGSATTTVDSDDEKYDWALNVHNKKHSFVEGQRHHYLVVLAFFLNKCGVSQSFTLNRFLSDYVGNGKTASELNRIVRDCYANTVDHGTFTINKKVQDLPQEASDNLKEVYVIAYSKNEAGDAWTDLDVTNICTRTYLSKTLVESVFKYVFENNKDAFGIDKKPEIKKVEYFINKQYDIRKNEITNRIDFKEKKAKEYAVYNIDTIFRDLQHANYKYPLDKLKSLMRSDFIPSYNPIAEYFNALPTWEADEDDYISSLASFVKTDDDAFFAVHLKKALVRTIAQALNHKVNRIILTLAGADQETGKTSFIRFLCPPQLKGYYTETNMTADKDSDIQLSENFIWNLEELAALHNNEINKLKAIFSKEASKQRAAYGEHTEVRQRRVSFFATTNKLNFLVDDQNTRWVVVNVKSIDHDYNNTVTGVKKINIDNVWAQALALFRTGFNDQLTKEEQRARDEKNHLFEAESMERDLILQHFQFADKGLGEFMTSTDILFKIQAAVDHKLKMNIHAVTRAMSQLEFTADIKKINGKSCRGFWVYANAQLPGTSNNQGGIFDDDGQDKPF